MQNIRKFPILLVIGRNPGRRISRLEFLESHSILGNRIRLGHVHFRPVTKLAGNSPSPFQASKQLASQWPDCSWHVGRAFTQEIETGELVRSRLLIVVIGLLVGFGARYIFVANKKAEERRFRSAKIVPQDIFADISVRYENATSEGGLILPIELPGQVLENYVSREDLLNLAKRQLENQFDSQSHDERAAHHAHGDKVCASGCAVSNHPTEYLPAWKYKKLMLRFAKEPLPTKLTSKSASTVSSSATDDSDEPTALDELVYYGRQTRDYLSIEGTFGIDQDYVKFLSEQLACNHAKIQIRVVDEHGVVRTWLPATRVPFDRRHVFDMEEKDLQPLVTSGTVKRVGLDYLWVRL